MSAERTAALRDTLEEKRAAIRRRHEEGGGGFEICRALCRAVDETVLTLCQTEGGGFDGAVVAQGGYGRGLLNPHSDVDLLFLLGDPIRGRSVRPPERMLARLWDIGLKVGHSARTIGEAVKMGHADLTVRASMMECRLLTGNRELYDRFRKKYAREVIRHKPARFIDAKIEEMESRRRLNGSVALLTEPNIKESAGGLRDLHTALWIMRSKDDVGAVEELAERGIIPAGDVAPVNRAYEFLLRVRNSLHWMAGGPSDTLAHELQPAIARMERHDGSDNVASAGLMKRYYQAAQTIERFTEELVAVARIYRTRFVWRPMRIDGDGLFADRRYLHAKAFPPADYDPEPELLFRIARRLSGENLDPSPNLRRGLEKLASEAPAGWFEGEAAGHCLLSILRLPNAARAIRVFHRTGVLRRFIPEMEPVTNLSQFDMFHRYTVDEHTMRTLDKLEAAPASAEVCSELKNIFRAQPEMETIKLALLLHDLGKRAEDHHAVEKDRRTPVILRRLGLKRLVKPVGDLVANHLLMSETGQRLNFSVPETLEPFCRRVGGRMNLKQLYLLTYADIAAVGPKIWNGWKDKILCDLYDAAERYYLEGASLFTFNQERLDKLIAAAALADDFDEGEIGEFLSRAPERYLINATAQTVTEHMRLLERMERTRVALRFTPDPGEKSGALTLAAPERIGFFSIVAGGIMVKNASINDAQIHTFTGDIALDTLNISGSNMSVFSDAQSLAKFETELADLLEGARSIDEMIERRGRYIRKKPAAPRGTRDPQVLILNHLSNSSTVVELWAPDRRGLLYDVTRAMAALRLDIQSAKINTEGRTAINVFYVTDERGGKIDDTERQESVRQSLLATLAGKEAAGRAP